MSAARQETNTYPRGTLTVDSPPDDDITERLLESLQETSNR